MIGLANRIGYDGQTGCWNFMGARCSKGYGNLRYQGRVVSAHRLAAHLWLRFDLSNPLMVLHKCDNPACFNPKHLFFGTNSDNQKDASAKGRHNMKKKTHCRNGHAYTPDNTRVRFCKGSWMRECRICVRHFGKIVDLKQAHKKERVEKFPYLHRMENLLD